MIERVQGLDTFFLSMESRTCPLQVAQACVFDPSTCPDGYSFEGVRALIEERLDLVPPFRRRLAEVPFGLHHPVWIEDPDFDLEHHLGRVVLRRPVGPRELADFTAGLVSRRLDRSKPLWEMYIVEGLEGGLVAGVTLVHHSLLDGVSGAELTATLLDTEPVPSQARLPGSKWIPDRVPNPVRLAVDGAAAIMRQPAAAAATARQAAAAMWRIRQRNRSEHLEAPPAPFSAPVTPFDTRVSSDRRAAFLQLDLADVKAVKEAFGVTVNDVLLACCAGSLAGVLGELGCRPEKPLVAAVPVSVRTDDERGTLGNRLSSMMVSLATTIEDPVRRLFAIASSAREAKAQDQLLGPRLISDMAELVSPALGRVLTGAATRTGLLHRPRPLCNVVVSTFPGPSFPLYCAGSRLVAPYPIGPIIDGAPLNITAQTYLDHIYMGVLADARTGPDPGDVAAGLQDALDELAKMAA